MERQIEISRKGGHGLDSLCELKNVCEGEMAGAPTVECDMGLEVICNVVRDLSAGWGVYFHDIGGATEITEWSLVMNVAEPQEELCEWPNTSRLNSELVKANKGCLSLLLVQGQEET